MFTKIGKLVDMAFRKRKEMAVQAKEEFTKHKKPLTEFKTDDYDQLLSVANDESLPDWQRNVAIREIKDRDWWLYRIRANVALSWQEAEAKAVSEAYDVIKDSSLSEDEIADILGNIKETLKEARHDVFGSVGVNDDRVGIDRF